MESPAKYCPIKDFDGSAPLEHSCCQRAVVLEAENAAFRKTRGGSGQVCMKHGYDPVYVHPQLGCMACRVDELKKELARVRGALRNLLGKAGGQVGSPSPGEEAEDGMSTYKNTPNPGSDEAIKQGCICAIADNAHGLGIPWPRDDGKDPVKNPSFWITVGCPLHHPEEEDAGK